MLGMVAFVYSYTNINREELTISCEKSSKNHTGTHSRVHFKIWPCEELTHKSQTHTEMEFLRDPLSMRRRWSISPAAVTSVKQDSLE